jgi:uncharacterized membrane protein
VLEQHRAIGTATRLKNRAIGSQEPHDSKVIGLDYVHRSGPKLNRNISLEDLEDRAELRASGRVAFARFWSAFGSAIFERDQIEAVRLATPLVWGTLLWAGILSSVAATTLVFWLVQKREAGRVTPYFLATPVVSIAIGWGFLGDVLTPQILTGAALTMAGVGVVALAERGLRAGAAKA